MTADNQPYWYTRWAGLGKFGQDQQTNGMKRYDNLFYKICSIDNLRLADEKARKGKKRNRGVRLFDRDREGNLERLHYLLLSGDYHTSRYTFFKVKDPKERTIARLPYYPDRIVHHAIMNVCGPIWQKIYTRDTYACIPGRGGHACRARLKEDLRKDPAGTRYCLKLDIRHYYPSVDHGIMKQIIRRKFKDLRLLRLLDEIIDSAPGLPIGNYLSQTLANVYLAYMDHYIKEVARVRYYYRYVDDIVVLAGDKAELRRVLAVLRQQLAGLRLEVKPNWQIFPVEARGVDFLGFVFRHGYILLRKRIKQHIFKACKRIRHAPMGLKAKRQAVASYIGWLKYTDSKHLVQTLNFYCNESIF